MSESPALPPEPTASELDEIVNVFNNRKDQFELFRRQVYDFFQVSRKFYASPIPLIHSLKSRLKDGSHLREKIKRKWADDPIKWADNPITPDNLFTRITDLAGVRVIHLYSKQFEFIHSAIIEQFSSNIWSQFEPPIAYSWDPEATAYFDRLGLRTEIKETYYTSIHYVIRPQPTVDLTCEIQVRTLFEEAWGEIDHAINYPNKSDSVACREQIRVLAKLASTGTRLADSIFTVSDHESSHH